MTTTVLPGIDARRVSTFRLTAGVLHRPATEPRSRVAVFLHGNVSSSLFWQPIMLALPAEVDAFAIDLRGFGDSEPLPVDATRGVRDFSDDVASVLDALGIAEPADVVGWSMGGGVAMQLLLDHPRAVRTLTLVAPVSPYGFGGTAADGTLLTPDAAGTGGGGANPDFVRRLAEGDRSEEAGSPRHVFRTAYVAEGYRSEWEDIWVESMLTTVTGTANYPGDFRASEDWPGFAPGTRGVLNTMAPTVFDTSGIIDVDPKPPVLWIHGSADVIVGNDSLFDLNQLGKLGIVPGHPEDGTAEPQPMVTQTRTVLRRYAERGGDVREAEFERCGHSPHLESPERFVREILGHWR